MKRLTVKSDPRATVLGVVAIVLWASTIAFARAISEDLGVVRTGSYVFLGSGLLGCLIEITRSGGIRRFADLSPRYLGICGPLFISNLCFLYAAIGTARSREAVLEVGIINYLWPSLVLVFSLLIQKNVARNILWLGVFLAVSGSIIATADVQDLSWATFLAHLSQNAFPFLMALGAAITWGLYSNLSRTLGRDSRANAVPLFLVASGIVLAILGQFLPEPAPSWTGRVAWELAYLIVLPTFLAYSLWDLAMQRGHFVIIVAISYLTPILSTLIAALWLSVRPGIGLWAGCIMVTVGAIISRYSVREVQE